jgi:hypothetical protein
MMEHLRREFPEPYVPPRHHPSTRDRIVVLHAGSRRGRHLYAAMGPTAMHLGNPKTVRDFHQEFLYRFQGYQGREAMLSRTLLNATLNPFVVISTNKKMVKRQLRTKSAGQQGRSE